MREPLLVLSGASLVALALALGFIAGRSPLQRNRDGGHRQSRQLTRAGCVFLATGGLYVVLVPGVGIDSAGTGISLDLGLGMLLLAGNWFIFRQEVVRYQVRVAAALYNVQIPADPALVRTAQSVGAWLRGVLFFTGLFLLLLLLIFR
ncbi:hypothetical protein [Arthrobacter sp. TE12232]